MRMARPCHGRYRFSGAFASTVGMLERAMAALDFASHASRRSLAAVLTE